MKNKSFIGQESNNSNKAKLRLPGLDDLAPLQSFKAEVFVHADKTTQEVCNFVLALAIVFNDLKDLRWALFRMQAASPDDRAAITRYRGEYAGFEIHLLKVLTASFKELFDLITAEKKSCNTLFF